MAARPALQVQANRRVWADARVGNYKHCEHCGAESGTDHKEVVSASVACRSIRTMDASFDKLEPTRSRNHFGVAVEVACDNPRTLQPPDNASHCLQKIKVPFGDALGVVEVDGNDVEPSSAVATHPPNRNPGRGKCR